MKKLLSMILILGLLLTQTACDGITINIHLDNRETTAATEQEGGSPSSEPAPPAATTIPVSEPEEHHPAPVTTAPPDGVTLTALEALWEKLHGCWLGDEDRYVFFTYTDEGPGFRSGTWNNAIPYGRDAALVTDLTELGSGLYTMELTYPPVSGDAADSLDLLPLHYTLSVDISNLENGTVRVKAPEDTWRDYTWASYSYDDAWDAFTQATATYASFEEMQEFWSWLTGYWNSEDGRFICFDRKDSNSLIFTEAVWDSGGRGWGYFEKAMSGYMDLPMEFVIYYPPVSNELDGELPSEYVLVAVDWMEVETHRHIMVKIGENGNWIKYTFAGYTQADAYPN